MKNSRMTKYAVVSLIAVLALGACDDNDPTGNRSTAQVRIINATTGAQTGGVNVFRGAQSLSSGIAQGQGNACTQSLTVPAGSQTLNVRLPASTTNTEVITHNFLANQRYTIVIYGTNADMRHTVILDEATQGTATASNRRLRFVNASTSGTAADVYATATATTAPSGTATAAGFAAGTGTSTYLNVPTANSFYRFYNAGNTTTNLFTYDASTATFPTSGNATIVFTGANAFQVNNCS